MTKRLLRSWTDQIGVLLTMLLALALGTGALGCGYGLVGRTSSLPEDIRAIYIQPLVNATSRSQIDQIYTRAISDEFVTRRRFTVVGSRSEADAQLVGTIKGFNVRPVAFNSDGRADEYQIQVYAQISFERVNSAETEVLWSRDDYLFRESYDVSEGGGNFTALEDVAIAEIAGKFAQTLVIEVLEGF